MSLLNKFRKETLNSFRTMIGRNKVVIAVNPEHQFTYDDFSNHFLEPVRNARGLGQIFGNRVGIQVPEDYTNSYNGIFGLANKFKLFEYQVIPLENSALVSKFIESKNNLDRTESTNGVLTRERDEAEINFLFMYALRENYIMTKIEEENLPAIILDRTIANSNKERLTRVLGYKAIGF